MWMTLSTRFVASPRDRRIELLSLGACAFRSTLQRAGRSSWVSAQPRYPNSMYPHLRVRPIIGLEDRRRIRRSGRMMTSDRDTPAFDARLKGRKDLRYEFEDSKNEIMALRIETKEEGEERAKREARGMATRRDVEEIGVVRFAGEGDVNDIRDYLWAAREAITDLEAMFNAEVPTLAFLATWGAFRLSYGLVMGSCFRSGDAFDVF
jgi:hypothetical protein